MSLVQNISRDNTEAISLVIKNTPIIGYHLQSVGRPTRYHEQFEFLAFQFAQAGFRQSDCAKLLGVSLSTFKNWLKHHANFAFEWKRGCLLADAEVAKAIYKLAVGYEDKVTRIVNEGDGSFTLSKYRIYPPNLKAAKLWLRNRQPQLWK